MRSHPIMVAAIACLFAAPRIATPLDPSVCFGIEVVDDDTGRSVPLVELRTINELRYVTDNAGRVAFAEPEL
ncbi:MAG TPA: hypothetical protein VHV77_11020, partial [Pirellulales bacterium]|nr:hypothetical protein [Pirellulales bacterium]